MGQHVSKTKSKLALSFKSDITNLSTPMLLWLNVRSVMLDLYEVGDWAIYTFVHYADKYSEDDYPGEVTLVAENEVTVSLMHRSGGQGHSSGGRKFWGNSPVVELIFSPLDQ